MSRIVTVTKHPVERDWVVIAFQDARDIDLVYSATQVVPGELEPLVGMLLASGAIRRHVVHGGCDGRYETDLEMPPLVESARQAMDAYTDCTGDALFAVRMGIGDDGSIESELEFNDYEIAWMDYDLRDELAEAARTVKNAWGLSPLTSRDFSRITQRVLDAMRHRKRRNEAVAR